MPPGEFQTLASDQRPLDGLVHPLDHHVVHPGFLPEVGHGPGVAERVDRPAVLRLHSEILPQPLVSLDQLVHDGRVVRGSLVGHDPASEHDLQLTPAHQPPHVDLDRVLQLVPPHVEEDRLGHDEGHVRVLGQLVDHVGEDVLGLVDVVLVHRLQPPGVLVRVGDDHDGQRLQVAVRLVRKVGGRARHFVRAVGVHVEVRLLVEVVRGDVRVRGRGRFEAAGRVVEVEHERLGHDGPEVRLAETGARHVAADLAVAVEVDDGQHEERGAAQDDQALPELHPQSRVGKSDRGEVTISAQSRARAGQVLLHLQRQEKIVLSNHVK